MVAGDVREYVLEWLQNKAQAEGIELPALSNDSDLLAIGVVDSLGFIELVTSVEEHFGCEVDFGSRYAEDFTTLAGFVNAVAKPEGLHA